MESALYGIYALVVFVSQILLVRCAHSFDFWYVNNSCVNTVRQHFPWIYWIYDRKREDQANAGSWLATKNALYYCAQSANSFTRVLFVSSYTTAIISPQLPGSFTKLSSPETKELPISQKTFRVLSTGAIQFALRKFCFWRITTYRK